MKKNKLSTLFWHNQQTETRLEAGVAFYEENYGEYRLKIDLLPGNRYYLRPVSSSDEKIRFVVEVVLKKKGGLFDRKIIGHGYSRGVHNREIWIEFGPFERPLVVVL